MTTQIGRKIYYELSTGNVIVDTGERQGDVVETTETQDWQLYTALQPYQQSAVGVMQLNFGDYAQNFTTYPYHVDITQTPPVIAWDTANPIGASLADVQKAKIAQLQDFCNQTNSGGFTSSALGTVHSYASDQTAMMNFANEFAYINSTVSTDTTVNWNTKEAGYTSHTKAQFNQVFTDGRTFQQGNWSKFFSLVGQVQAATTVDAVNAIAW